MRRDNCRVRPDGRQPLVALDPRIVVVQREAKLITSPDEETLGALLGGEQAVDHLVDVVGPGRGPDGDVEGVEAVAEELLGVGPLDEMEGVALGGPVEEGTVEIHDDENATRGGEGHGRGGCAEEVAGRWVWDAS